MLNWEKSKEQIFLPSIQTKCHFHNLERQLHKQVYEHIHTHTRASVCLKSFLWLHLRHGATTHAWNHLCRHTSINQHRKDVWHHETTRFTTQAESSKCFHTELYSSALLTASFTCLITLLWFCYLYFMYSMCVCCVCVCNVRCFLGLMPQFCHFVWYQTFNTPHNKLQWCFFFHILHIRDMF